MPASVSPSVSSHSSQVKNIKPLNPSKRRRRRRKEKSCLKMGMEDNGIWTLSLVWTISPPRCSCLSDCRLTEAHTEFWRTWHRLEITVLLPLQTAEGQGPRHTVTVSTAALQPAWSWECLTDLCIPWQIVTEVFLYLPAHPHPTLSWGCSIAPDSSDLTGLVLPVDGECILLPP